MHARRALSLLPILLLLSLATCSGDGGGVAPGIETFDPPAGKGALAPGWTAAVDGGAWLSWLEPRGPASDGAARFALRVARFDGTAWSGPFEVTEGPDFFANWADRPAVAVAHDGWLAAHWLAQLGEGTYAYGVRVAGSDDGGETWNELGLLHDDSSPTEHGFVSWVREGDGLRAFWLDGRDMLEAEAGAVSDAKGGAMQLRTARLHVRGEPEPSTLLDARVCECCPTAAAVTSQGPVVAYRDRSEGERRDIAVIRATGEGDGGWSEPTLVHEDGWEISGCPVNGPALAARGSQVAVAWFTAEGARARVQLAFSEAAGARFGKPVLIDGVRPLGRVDLALDDDGTALVSWLATVGDEAALQVRRVSPAGKAGPARTLAHTSARRAAGVPRILRQPDGLLVAWVEDGEPSRLRSGILRELPGTGNAP